MRDTYLKKFGFMLPCTEPLDELQKADHVVEIGAGAGYMTAIMRHRGIRAIGSDPHVGYRPLFARALDDACR